MTDRVIEDAKTRARELVDYLAEMTQAAERDPKLDVLATSQGGAWPVLWLEELPEDIEPPGEEEILRVPPPAYTMQPPPPPELREWLEPDRTWPYDGPEPELLSEVRADPWTAVLELDPGTPNEAPSAEPSREVVQLFERWLAEWRHWAQERLVAERIRPVYEFLEDAAKTIEQRDDEYELVLAQGLIRWTGPDGRRVRRHLEVEQVTAVLERGSADAVVTGLGVSRRWEDRQVLGHVESYDGNRGAEARGALAEAADAEDRAEYVRRLGTWVNRLVNVEALPADAGTHAADTDDQLRVADAPALVLRPRNRAALAEAYKQISRELQDPETPVPVALAQLVIDTEPSDRQRWVTDQGGESGDFLGQDPRFPLEANPQQERVMELLRTETGVVVQGPPGTGKTHTIANLMSALLARGQRVLVTSQKDQALRVLRNKIPPELRRLCVLLTGGSRGSAKELQQSLEALSDAVASSDAAALRISAQSLSDERSAIKARAEVLNRRIQELREVEYTRHKSVVPWLGGDRYAGTLGDIVRRVKTGEASYGWFPEPRGGAVGGPPPLTNGEALELRRLFLGDGPERRARVSQWVPEPTELPSAAEFVTLLQERTTAEEKTLAVETPISRELAKLPRETVDYLSQLRRYALEKMSALGYDDTGHPVTAPTWVARALGDLLAGHASGLWGTVMGVRGEAARLQSRLHAQGNDYVVDLPPVSSADIGRARGEFNAAKAFLDYLRRGGRFKRFASTEQKAAQPFISRVTVNGAAPNSPETLAAALERLEAEIATLQLVDKWADCGVDVPTGRLNSTLSDLTDRDRYLAAIQHVVDLHQILVQQVEPVGLGRTIDTPERLLNLLAQVEPALLRLRSEESARRVSELESRMRQIATRADACPETAAVLTALREGDAQGYERALGTLTAVREQKALAQRQADLAARLAPAHLELRELLAETADDVVWEDRLADLDEAWAWYEARRFVTSKRTAQEERRLAEEFRLMEDQLKSVTARLAATEAIRECLERMTDAHARALRSFRQHKLKVAGGQGKNAHQYQAAARQAMDKAKTAVPAWVVPLPTLLDNIPLERNSFDVVIVDEASQVGMEQLFLLWLAPRVIVVGDDKQCTPGEARLGTHDRIQAGLQRHLANADHDIRQNFTAKTDLYGLLSARSGKDAVIRLREHFRCVPEIITWSSTQFYGTKDQPGLIPLRERSAGDLEPLVVSHVTDGFTEGRDARVRNPVEAKLIAEQLAACIDDPRYRDKTFGVVVLQGRGQVRLLEHEIAERIPPDVRIERKIRVGVASDFQGDERNVIFLSMVAAPPPNGRRLRAQRMLMYQQSLNVAASRAEDQLWMFTSVGLEHLAPDDLRASLLGYMLDPPSMYGRSPDLEDVSDDRPTAPFESLLEQRVFSEIKRRGYHVVPQYAVGARSLDLVVVGEGARVAVECDGHRHHMSPDQVVADARRDRELARMKWEVVRIRESEFEFDRDKELGRLWPVLVMRGVRPHASGDQRFDGWSPVSLTDEDDERDVDE